MEEITKESSKFESPSNALLDFDQLLRGEFLPARGGRSVFAEAVQEKSDFSETEAHFAGEANEQDAVERFRRIAPMAVEAMRRREQALRFVVADGGSIEACTSSKFADLHGRSAILA